MAKPRPTDPTRRQFLGTTAAVAGAATLPCLGLTTSGCSGVPEVEFPAGSVSELPVGARRFREEEKVFVVHSDQGYAAISAKCTHLGCTVVESTDGADGALECPCHGSAFAPDGSVTEGPADEPLPWYAVRFEGDTILVDGRKPVPAGTWSTPA